MGSVAYVALSGGIDSTTVLYWAINRFTHVHAVSVYYGQRHSKEMDYAQESCMDLGVAHHILKIDSIIPTTMLTDPTAKVPDISYDDITGVSPTYVPFRNGLIISSLTAFTVGQKLKAKDDEEWSIGIGVHAEDARNWAYPDCTPEFIGAMQNAIFVGTYYKIRLLAPLQYLNKVDIILLGESLGVDWAKTWSCYKGETLQCGTCMTCRARREGFRKAGVTDPTKYAV